ncbi:MAG TPA: hypothetical protein VMU80_12295 [Bryobacteraceae bacterium]|nr:hypothetical protein [Bryobacteraceae bacterium]
MLKAMLVAGLGRTGSTALMTLLATAPRMFVDRVFPLENRYLTYLAKLAVLLERQAASPKVTGQQLYDFANNDFGSYPWQPAGVRLPANQWLHSFWETFSVRAAELLPGAEFYAEKVPAWLPARARETIPVSTIYLFRDPRDIYLSSNAFMRRRGTPGFGRSRSDTELDYARTVAHGFLSYFENYFMDRRRPDCLLVNYPEMVVDSNSLPVRLQRELGLDCHWESTPAHEAHRTAPDWQSSLGRWSREPLPAEAGHFLRKYLHAPMVHLGYTEGHAPAVPLKVEFRSGAFDPARLGRSPEGQILLGEDALDVIVTSSGHGMVLPLPPFDARPVREIWVSLSGNAGDACSVYWRSRTEGFSEERSVHVDYCGGPHWQVLRFPVAKHRRWKGAVAELRLDPFHRRSMPADVPERGSLRWVTLID